MRHSLRLGLFLAAYYATNSIYQNYLSLFYTGVGFSSTQIGVIFACVAAVSVAAQAAWGLVADRARSRNALLRLLIIAAAVLILTFLLSDRFAVLLALAMLFSAFYTSILPLGDSIVLENLNGRPFGPIRLMGSLTFGTMAVATGSLLGGGGPVIIWALAGMCLLTLLSTYLLPQTPGRQSQTGRRMTMGALLRMPELMQLMTLSSMLLLALGYFYTFYSPHFMSLPGASGGMLGLGYLLSSLSEIPFLFLCDRLYKRHGAGRLICLAALLLGARFLIVGFSNSWLITLLSQLMHGWCFIVITVCMACYINFAVPPELRASGQMLLGIVSFGFARVAGNLLGGYLADVIGRRETFFVAAAVCLTAFLIFTPIYLRRPPVTGQAAE